MNLFSLSTAVAILLSFLMTSAIAAPRAPECSPPNISKTDKKKVEIAFKDRYCADAEKDRCEDLWGNFSKLLSKVVADERVNNITSAAFLFATAYAETFSVNFSPAAKERKGNANSNLPYWQPDHETGQEYYGRGWVQLTWKDKYRLANNRLGIDLLNNPTQALELDISYEILVRALLEGWLETYRSTPSGGAGNVPIRLGDFLSINSADYASARAVINANCQGKCTNESRVLVPGKGYIPVPKKIDAALKVETEAQFFERVLCYANAQPGSPVFDKSTKSVSNWKSEATEHIGFGPDDFQRKEGLRCVKLNNYWCLKDFGWQGGIGHDSDNHTAFVNGNMAARAAVRNLRTSYIKHKRLSAFAVMSTYAPPDDCIGSNTARKADGTCIYGKNQTTLYAKRVASGITDDLNADLSLFDAQGNATESLVIFMSNISSFELAGAKVDDETIRKGICLEDNTCKP